MPDNIAISFEQVSFRIMQKELISNLNFSIETGESLILLGRSGSGKTTTLKLINSLIKPSEGRIIVQGRFRVSFVIPTDNAQRFSALKTCCCASVRQYPYRRRGVICVLPTSGDGLMRCPRQSLL